jgi:hypothetical protein
MAQQTALEQFIEWAISLKDKEQQCTDWIVIKQKAEELLPIEKQQTIKFANDFVDDDSDMNAEEFYNETYGTRLQNETNSK